MELEHIKSKLDNSHQACVELVKAMDENQAAYHPTGKWNAQAHMVHLTMSLRPLSRILKKPRFAIRYLFGKPNRPSRSYDELVGRYRTRLADARPGASSPFSPSENDAVNKNRVLSEYEFEHKKLIRAIRGWKEKDLDKYILPHPLLGKVTVREMLFFTDYHTLHHLDIIRNIPQIK